MKAPRRWGVAICCWRSIARLPLVKPTKKPEVLLLRKACGLIQVSLEAPSVIERHLYGYIRDYSGLFAFEETMGNIVLTR